MTNNDIVQKLWNLCDVLRDDGINYSDYVTELVLLLFIKMVHESTEAGTLKEHPLPEGCRWTDLSNNKSGIELLEHYKGILNTLATGKRMEANPERKGEMIEVLVHSDPLLMEIYAEAHTRLREPRHLEQIIKRFDEIKDWFSDKRDGLGSLYEGLLDKNANETKSGAGQYFTPRALINSIVRCVKPLPGEIIQDPAAGTAGFLVTAHEYVKSLTKNLEDLNAHQQYIQKNESYIGVELVPNTRRLALMNCLLHGIEGEGVVRLGNALGDVGKQLPPADIILANPPFGSSRGGDASIYRDDLPYETTNKQLAFLQHIYLNLKPGGRAAVVLPDNVLFETGKGTDIRRDLLDKCNLHTVLRLPRGIFYAQGVQTNVIFFTKGSATQDVWVYDLRTNMPNFGKRTPFTEEYLKPFERVFGDNPKGKSKRSEGEWSFNADEFELDHVVSEENVGIDDQKLAKSRWRCFSRDWIRDIKGDSLDISWLKDRSSMDVANLPDPEVLALDAKNELEKALNELDNLLNALEGYK
ncbi:N-6 DNA methylase [Vibrio vulnificus]|nr:N-6 DNA methylase [Vibrio vulnificus]